MSKPPSPIEIERKFLVTGDDWRLDAVGRHIQQGYLSPQRGIRRPGSHLRRYRIFDSEGKTGGHHLARVRVRDPHR